MKRQEAIELLNEISKKCGENMIVDSIWLTPRKEPIEPFSESPEAHFKICMKATLDNYSEKTMTSIAHDKGLKMIHAGNLIIIDKPIK